MKINFAVFGATLAAGVVTMAPAEAISIDGTSLSAGTVNLEESGTTTTFSDFNDFTLTTTGILGVFDSVDIFDFTIEDSDNDEFYDFDFVNNGGPLKTYSGPGSLTASFFIDSGVWERQVTGSSARNYNQIGSFLGRYVFSDGREFSGAGRLDFIRANTGTSEAVFIMDQDVEAIPTPALLPGLLGMGAVAFRKRKRETVNS